MIPLLVFEISPLALFVTLDEDGAGGGIEYSGSWKSCLHITLHTLDCIFSKYIQSPLLHVLFYHLLWNSIFLGSSKLSHLKLQKVLSSLSSLQKRAQFNLNRKLVGFYFLSIRFELVFRSSRATIWHYSVFTNCCRRCSKCETFGVLEIVPLVSPLVAPFTRFSPPVAPLTRFSPRISRHSPPMAHQFLGRGR